MIRENKEILLAAILLFLLGLILDPFDWFMPSMLEMMFLLILVLMFAVFAGFVWREYSGDEREARHRQIAGRWAFLAGASTLMLGIVIQSLQHRLDHWLLYALAVMIFTKFFGLLYSRKKF